MIQSLKPIDTNARIKWAYALASAPGLPETWREAAPMVRYDARAPRANDIIVAQVERIGRHSRIDLRDMRIAKLFEEDLIGVAFSPRYATRQFEAIVPTSLEEVHFLCAGGVCGLVTGVPNEMTPPTQLRALGYVVDAGGERVNLRDHALTPMAPRTNGADVVVVVGSAMDSGKTTAAYSLVNGLSRAGRRVSAAKITGTASAKDLRLLSAAGAFRVLDFTNVGFGSTADLSRTDLAMIINAIISNLAADDPDAIVLEIADGVTQRETSLLLELLSVDDRLTGVMYTCNDSLGIVSGLELLKRYGLPVLAVSGVVTASPLSMREAQRETNQLLLSREELRSPDVIDRLGLLRGEDRPPRLSASVDVCRMTG